MNEINKLYIVSGIYALVCLCLVIEAWCLKAPITKTLLIRAIIFLTISYVVYQVLNMNNIVIGICLIVVALCVIERGYKSSNLVYLFTAFCIFVVGLINLYTGI